MHRGRPRYKDVLTPREWEVLGLLEEGLTNEEIAHRLGISFAGARYHVAEIISKLGVSGRVEAAAWAQSQKARGRRWALIPAFAIPRFAGSPPIGIAAAGTAALVLGLAVLFAGAGGSSSGGVPAPPPLSAVDGGTGEEFFRAVDLPAPLSEGEVLYMRAEVYERHGPKSAQITAANGIPVEHYVRETWLEAGPDDSLALGVGRVLDENGEPILLTMTQDGVSRTYDVRAGRLFSEDTVPDQLEAMGDMAAHIERYRGAIASGEATIADQTPTRLVLQFVSDRESYARALEDRDLPEEVRQRLVETFLQRGMSEDGFAVPYYGDLDATAVTRTMVIDTRGLTVENLTTIDTEGGDRFVVQSSVLTHWEVVEAVPDDILASIP